MAQPDDNTLRYYIRLPEGADLNNLAKGMYFGMTEQHEKSLKAELEAIQLLEERGYFITKNKGLNSAVSWMLETVEGVLDRFEILFGDYDSPVHNDEISVEFRNLILSISRFHGGLLGNTD